MQLTVPAAGINTRISVLGALPYATGTVTSHLADRAVRETFMVFLEQLLAEYPERHLTLVLDNAGDHQSALVDAWFARHRSTITVLALPPYCPELNLIEGARRTLKHQLACHRFWNESARLKDRRIYLLGHLVARFHRGSRGGFQHCPSLGKSTWV